MKKIGLALSGGGYRAAAFHLGTLNKLHQMKILEKIEVMSTISGGSITGAAWGLHNGSYPDFHDRMKTLLETKSVLKYIFCSILFIRFAAFLLLFLGGAIALSLSPYAYLVFPVLIVFLFLFFKFQYKIFPAGLGVERAYDKFFYHGKTLADFKNVPTIAIGSSNLHSGRPFTFSQEKMSDSTYTTLASYNPPIKFKNKQFPVSRAVTASSCVPFGFSPVKIDKAFFEPESDFSRVKPVLIDGGVYDNQGIQKLTQSKSSYECEIIITSDAGGNFIDDKKYPNVLSLLLRTVDLFMYRIKTSQMAQHIYRNSETGKPIAYITLAWELEKLIPGFIDNMVIGKILPSVIAAHNFDPDWVANPAAYRSQIEKHLMQKTAYTNIAKNNLSRQQWLEAVNVGTNLTPLDPNKTQLLIRHAENITELQVKLYCPAPLT